MNFLIPVEQIHFELVVLPTCGKLFFDFLTEFSFAFVVQFGFVVTCLIAIDLMFYIKNTFADLVHLLEELSFSLLRDLIRI